MKLAAVIVVLFLATIAAARFQEDVPWTPDPDPTPYEWPTPVPTPEPTPVCDHTSNSSERFDQIRLLPPLKIKNFDPHSIEYLFEDRIGIHVGRLTADDTSVMPANVWKEYKDRWYWVLYCVNDGHIYTMVEVSPGQLKAAKPAARKFP